MCTAFEPLEDLHVALQAPPEFGADSPLSSMIRADHELAHLAVGRSALGANGSAQARALGHRLAALEAHIETRRDQLNQSLSALQRTHANAESALDSAALCDEVDMSTEHAPIRAACAPAARLWAAVRAVDLTSQVSSSSIAAHVGELDFGPDRNSVRDSVIAALDAHAKALGRLTRLAGSTADPADPVRRDVIESLDGIGRACFAGLTRTTRTVGGSDEARSVTVTVRPKWSGSLARLPQGDAFGSGFIVRWRTASGRVETLVVTNNHVMAGALEAEIHLGDAEPPKLRAVLVHADPYDDVAVLRLDRGSQRTFADGVSFRFTPAEEQEQVLAAGFPGIGVKPSFQVSKGTVSNAKFGAEDPKASPLHAYVQHTAPIDPGNSGGPLFDADGRLLGMNTLKVFGRDSVGLAIPAPRIQRALLRAEHPVTLNDKHALASCNAVVAALASAAPEPQVMSRFGLALYEWTQAQPARTDEGSWRDLVQGPAETPTDFARWSAYASVRSLVEADGGVRPFEVCFDLSPSTGKERTFVAKFRTRIGTRTLTLADERGSLRAVGFR